MSVTIFGQAIFDNLTITKDVDTQLVTPPTTWNKDIILNCNFNGNIDGGNFDYTLAQSITEIKIKRRVKGEFDWTTIHIASISSLTDLSFVYYDTTALPNVTYEYTSVPVYNGVEGAYVMAEETALFKGVFICDNTGIYRLYGGAAYGDTQQNQQVGVLLPYGRKYPVIVANGNVGYQTGSISGQILPNHYYQDGILDAQEIAELRVAMQNFLTNKLPKIVKDRNGNSWLVVFTGNPKTSYDSNMGMRMVSISADWTEVGEADDKDDLYKAGLIPTNE